MHETTQLPVSNSLGQAAADPLDAIVRRIVELAHPLQIILFGSAARGDANSAATSIYLW